MFDGFGEKQPLTQTWSVYSTTRPMKADLYLPFLEHLFSHTMQLLQEVM